MIQGARNGYVPIDEPGVPSGRRRLRVSGAFLRFLGAGFAILAAIVSCKSLSRVHETGPFHVHRSNARYFIS